MTEYQEQLNYLNGLMASSSAYALSAHVKHRAEWLEAKYPATFPGLTKAVQAEYTRLKAAALARQPSSSSSEKPDELQTTETAGATPAGSRTRASKASTGRRNSSSAAGA